MNTQAIYMITENGLTQYAYAQYGANYATGIIRYTEACSIAEKIKLPIADIIMDITYDGKYIPTENNGNKVFNKIENAELSDEIVQSFTECGLVKSMITIDMDRDLYKYQASSRQSSEDIILPLSEAVRISRTKTEELDRKSEVWSICELSDILKPEFKALRKKYDYAMDIVIVKPGLPAEHIVLDVSENKLRAMQKTVDGLIEPIYALSEPGMIVFGNEEARLLGMELNRRFPGQQPVCGTFFICGNKNEGCCSLTDEQINKYLQKYKIPDRFSDYERAAAHDGNIVFHPFSEPKITTTPTRHGRN